MVTPENRMTPKTQLKKSCVLGVRNREVVCNIYRGACKSSLNLADRIRSR